MFFEILESPFVEFEYDNNYQSSIREAASKRLEALVCLINVWGTMIKAQTYYGKPPRRLLQFDNDQLLPMSAQELCKLKDTTLSVFNKTPCFLASYVIKKFDDIHLA